MSSNEKPLSELINFGIINLDKPAGPTSFSVSDFVRKSLNINKTSHAGTLDPQVTGVLPILLGRACRLSDFFMHKDKTYVGIMRLHKEIDEDVLKKTIEKFIGKIIQLPPVRSSVKRAVREREVKHFKILEIQGKDVLFETQVQAGTYIRTLCDNIGKEIGGAHMLELRRTQAGIFSESDDSFINLYDFEKALEEHKARNDLPLRKIIIPADIALQKVMHSIEISDKNIKQLLTGKPLMSSDLIGDLPDSEIFAAFCSDKLIGVYKKSESKGDILAKALFVYN